MNISENTRPKSEILGTPNKGPMTSRFLHLTKKSVRWTVPLKGFSSLCTISTGAHGHVFHSLVWGESLEGPQASGELSVVP